jgi:hypothetical protein
MSFFIIFILIFVLKNNSIFYFFASCDNFDYLHDKLNTQIIYQHADQKTNNLFSSISIIIFSFFFIEKT